MKTLLFPPRVLRLFSAGFGFLLLPAILALTACASPTDPNQTSYTVTFHHNGGDTQANPQSMQVVAPETTVDALPTAPSREGYDFAGWNTRADGTGSAFTAASTVTGDITVYAQWNEIYTVTFHDNGGDTQASPQAMQVIFPATTLGGLPMEPARAGHDFVGWNTQADGAGDAFTAATTVTASITVYAQWTVLPPTGTTYTVTFINIGDVQTMQVVSPATTLGTLPTEPTRAGYSFAGWNTLPGGQGTAFTANTTVTSSITVYAQWNPNTYTVTFNKNGGNTEANPQTKQVVSPATTLGTLPTAPTKAGHVFSGWNTKADGTGDSFTAATTVTANITVYAQWNPATYKVTFNKHGGDTEASPQAMQVVFPASALGTLPAAPTRTGYTFEGWNTKVDGTGTSFTAAATVTANITVYAQWLRIYTVIFNKYGGDTDADPPTKQVASPATTVGTLPTAPTRAGYTFEGWNTKVDGTGTSFTAATTVTANITVYARWTKLSTYTVTFNKNGGDTEADPPTKQVASPATTVGSLPTAPTRAGHTFAGWNTQASGAGTPFAATTTVTANITVYAQWIVLPPPGTTYTVTFDKNGGGAEAIPQTKQVVSPATTVGTLPTAPTRMGHTFAGWNTQASGAGTSFTAATTVTGNITVYARWNPVTYTVTFHKNGGGTEASPQTKQVVFPATTVGTLPAAPTRAGHSFAGWNTLQSGSGTPFTAATTVTANIIVYARWTALPIYTVTFDKNGGDTEASPKTMQVTSSSTTALPTAPAKTGYIFAGWNTRQDGTGTAFTVATLVTANITVYAQWQYPPGTQPVGLRFSDPGLVAFDQTAFTVVKDGSPASQSISLTGTWTSREWRVDGKVRGNEINFTVDAADYTVGGHTLEVVVFDAAAVPWSKTLRFTVAQAVTGISLKSLTLPVGGSETLYATILPANASNKTVAWSSSDPGVVSVNASTGLVNADALGEATITATSQDGEHEATCTVTVVAAQGISLSFSDPGADAFIGTAFTVIRDSGSASQLITLTGSWPSREWRVDGKVRGNEINFTVDAADYTVGGHVLELVVFDAAAVPWSKTLRFTVVQPVTELRLNKDSLTLPVGGSETLYATILPANASNKTLAWSSSNSDVASVNASGLVSAIDPGMATITATSQDGNLAKSCAVTVATAQDISLRFSDPGAGAFDGTAFTVKKDGSPASQTISLTGTWDSKEWRVDGKVRGAGTSFKVNAADYTEGGHLLELVVVKEGVPWSKTLRFRVASN
jgi:uncharacterized repeat protein (TIGR02543 family)